MKTTKQAGIWMDYAIAYVMELKGNSVLTTEIKSEFTWEEKQHSFFKNENLMHNKERHLVAAYFNEVGNLIQGFDEVVLFGPGDAKTELFNRLLADNQFQHVRLSAVSSDNLTENQRKAFVKKYFHPTVLHST